MILSGPEWQAVFLSLRVSAIAVAISLPFGILFAWILVRCRFLGKTLLDGIIHLPLVLPPVVVGYLLLIAMGGKQRRRTDNPRRVIGQILRKAAGAENKQIRHIPALKIFIHCAGRRIIAHHRTARGVCRLIRADIIVRAILFKAHFIALWPDALGYLLSLTANELSHFQFVRLPIERHALKDSVNPDEPGETPPQGHITVGYRITRCLVRYCGIPTGD